MKQALLSTIVILMLLAFAGIGIAHIFRPDYFIKRSGVRRGGALLTEWNRLGFQIAGASSLVSQSTFCTSFSDDERYGLPTTPDIRVRCIILSGFKPL
jgi:hypothetical protein